MEKWEHLEDFVIQEVFAAFGSPNAYCSLLSSTPTYLEEELCPHML